MDCGDVLIYQKFALIGTHPFRKRRFRQISLNCAGAIEKRSRRRAFQRAIDEPSTLPLCPSKGGSKREFLHLALPFISLLQAIVDISNFIIMWIEHSCATCYIFGPHFEFGVQIDTIPSACVMDVSSSCRLLKLLNGILVVVGQSSALECYLCTTSDAGCTKENFDPKSATKQQNCKYCQVTSVIVLLRI